MKTNCDVIKDLMPLYIDDVCTFESKILVEEHIAECAICKNELIKLTDKIPDNSDALYINEINPFKKIKKRNNLKLLFVTVCIIIIALLFCMVLLRSTKKTFSSNFIEVKVDYNSINVNNLLKEVKRTVKTKWNISDDTTIYDIYINLNKDGQLKESDTFNMNLFDPTDDSYYEVYICPGFNQKDKVSIQIQKISRENGIDRVNRILFAEAENLFKNLDLTSIQKNNYDSWFVSLIINNEDSTSTNNENTNSNKCYYLENGIIQEGDKSSLGLTGRYYNLIVKGLMKGTEGEYSNPEDSMSIIVKQ